MQPPSTEAIDEIRIEGFRPQVVGCILHDRKILFVFKEEHDLWQLPQGGIDNRENVVEAAIREMKEELGEEFATTLHVGELVGRDKLIFPRHLQDARGLESDDGQKRTMKGKEYFFLVLEAGTSEIDTQKTEFDDHQWANYEQALRVGETIYQKGKKRVTVAALEALHNEQLI